MKELHEFDTLEEATSYSVAVQKMVSNSLVFSLLGEHDSALTLQTQAKTNDRAASFLMALNNGGVGEYNLMTGHPVGDAHQSGLQDLVDISAVTAGFQTAILALSNLTESKPYKDVTLLQFNQAKKIYTEKPVLDWSAGKSILVTLNENLTNGAITAWSMESGFGYKNLGRPEHIQDGVGKYRIDLSGVKVVGDVYIRIPFESLDYTVEAD